jgi:hypothetical protein
MDADKLPKEIVYNDVYNTDVNYHGRAGLSSIIYAYAHEAENKGHESETGGGVGNRGG